MIRLLLVDDEAPARRRLRRLLASVPDVAVAGEAANGPDAVRLIRESPSDAVLLDVRMPGLDGFGVVREVGPDRMPPVVFVTAFDDRALQAFEVEAVDYLLKPVSGERLARAVDRLRRRLSGEQDASLAGKLERLLSARPKEPGPLRHLTAWSEGSARIVPVESVDRLEAERNQVRVHAGGSSFAVRGPLADLAARLDPSRFLRVNRGTVVRLDAIERLEQWFHGDVRVVMRDGTRLLWSRRYGPPGADGLGPR